MAAVVDLRGTTDALGRELKVTEVCVADEIAGAAELVMGKVAGVPVAIVRGVDPSWLRESSVHDEIVRPTARTSSAEAVQGFTVRTQSTVAATPASRVVHGFQPRWMAARAGFRLDRLTSPGRAGP